jgi:predicted nucleic acid-binding protein
LAYLKDNPEKVKEYTRRVEEATLQILEIPGLLLIELTTSQSLQALSVMGRHGLLPRDALHTAAVFETGIGAIITTDADFAKVDGLQVYTCNPKALRMTQDTNAG